MSGTRAREGPGSAIVAATRVAAPVGETGVAALPSRYRLGRRLGAGAFGTVYEAEDLRRNRMVAVKVIDVAGASPERARREAAAAARLDHPGIVALYDTGESGATRYLVSELVRGRTLAELEADADLSDRDVLRIGLALADALRHAHRRGVVHRDIKPHNVMVPDQARHAGGAGSPWRSAAKLTDFGVASLAGDATLTQTGDVVGTLAYMAPEQAAGERVDARADVYSLGLLLYEALAGFHPVRGGGPATTARRVGTRLPALRSRRGDLPHPLSAAIDAALLPDPARRPTLEELSGALAGALPRVSDEGGTLAAHPRERASRPLSPAATRGLAAAAAATLAGVGLAWFAPGIEPPAPVVGAAVGLLVALLPRLGWLAGAGLVLAAVALGPAPQPAAAAVLLPAVAAPPLLLRRRGLLWSAPAAAPLLGAIVLAPAFPALAGRAPTVGARAGLAAAGALWLLAAESLTGRALLLGDAAGRSAVAAGAGSQEALLGLAGAGAGALIALWAVAAAVLPWVVRGRSRAFDVVAAILWTGALIAGTVMVAGQSTEGALSPGELSAGAMAALVMAAWRRRDAEY